MGFRHVVCCLVVLAVCTELAIGQLSRLRRLRRVIRPGAGNDYVNRPRGCRPPVCPRCDYYSYDRRGCRICTCDSSPYGVTGHQRCPRGSRSVNPHNPTHCSRSGRSGLWNTRLTCRREFGEFCSSDNGICCVYEQSSPHPSCQHHRSTAFTTCRAHRNTCSDDYDCSDNKICCDSGCGRRCVRLDGRPGNRRDYTSWSMG